MFDAIDEDVAPLRSLLPQPPSRDDDEDRRDGDSAPSGSAPSGSGSSAPPSTGRGDSSEPGGTDSRRPSESADSDGESDGL
ncbi:hypothetical protein NGM37_13580, partial [Streptomyces sp. TRM76130]|nr:hypothetical protein [Streptomyces sp. TRM76130]